MTNTEEQQLSAADTATLPSGIGGSIEPPITTICPNLELLVGQLAILLLVNPHTDPLVLHCLMRECVGKIGRRLNITLKEFEAVLAGDAHVLVIDNNYDDAASIILGDLDGMPVPPLNPLPETANAPTS